MNSFFEKFKLNGEKEDLEAIIKNIENGVVFRGTNLWILIFAIFVASLGLNVNSTAVIIGAMLISPLMGPIMGIGLGIGINDVSLLRKAILNYVIAIAVALVTSTIFFLVTPLIDAHSEIIARTSPTIYDVLIAVFGGFAGILAVSSKQKGNVIPGVAIATALMPPLCTAGYGLATFQFKFFFGAFYLFIINTVFIALATFIIVRILHFPHKHLQNPKAERIAQKVVWLVVTLTLIPSLYFGYDMVQQTRFTSDANRFVANEVHFANDYLLNKKIDPKKRTISLIFGGEEISEDQINGLKKQLAKYGLQNTELEIKQGFAYLAESKDVAEDNQMAELTRAMGEKDKQQKVLQARLDSIAEQKKMSLEIYKELKILYPSLKSAVIQPSFINTDSITNKPIMLVALTLPGWPSKAERSKLENWVKLRMKQINVQLIFQK